MGVPAGHALCQYMGPFEVNEAHLEVAAIECLTSPRDFFAIRLCALSMTTPLNLCARHPAFAEEHCRGPPRPAPAACDQPSQSAWQGSGCPIERSAQPTGLRTRAGSARRAACLGRLGRPARPVRHTRRPLVAIACRERVVAPKVLPSMTSRRRATKEIHHERHEATHLLHLHDLPWPVLHLRLPEGSRTQAACACGPQCKCGQVCTCPKS